MAVNYVIAVNATLAIVNTAESWMQELANALVVMGHGVEILAECLLPESHCGKGGKLNKESCSCECASGNGPKKSVEEQDGDDYVAWGDAFSEDDAKNDGDNSGTSTEEKNKWLSWADAFNFLQTNTVEKLHLHTTAVLAQWQARTANVDQFCGRQLHVHQL